jgi:hypothetical protein
MNSPSSNINIFEESKIQATILLKDLRSEDPIKIQLSIKRLRILSKFQNNSVTDIINQAKRKDALLIIALEKGFDSWLQLKNYFYRILSSPFEDNYVGGFLNLWFTRYVDAKSQQKKQGGYLLPYKKQYFLANEEYIKALGLDPFDPDWKLIDWDWVKAKDKNALNRLFQKWLMEKGERQVKNECKGI